MLILIFGTMGSSLTVPMVFAADTTSQTANSRAQVTNDTIGSPSANTESYLASSGTYPKNFKELVTFFLGFINKILPILVAMTMLVFFWGLIGLIRNSGDEKAVKDGKQLMLWGIVGLFVLISFAGIISLFTGDFFGQSFGIPQLPEPASSGATTGSAGSVSGANSGSFGGNTSSASTGSGAGGVTPPGGAGTGAGGTPLNAGAGSGLSGTSVQSGGSGTGSTGASNSGAGTGNSFGGSGSYSGAGAGSGY